MWWESVFTSLLGYKSLVLGRQLLVCLPRSPEQVLDYVLVTTFLVAFLGFGEHTRDVLVRLKELEVHAREAAPTVEEPIGVFGVIALGDAALAADMLGGVGPSSGLLGVDEVDDLPLEGSATSVATGVGCHVAVVAGAVEVAGAGRHLGRRTKAAAGHFGTRQAESVAE